MASRRAHLRALGYLGRLGDSAVVPPADNTAPTAWEQISGIPGATLADLWDIAWSGNVTPDVVNAINAQTAAQIQQASGGTISAADALAQAQQSTNQALTTFTAPGGFGITWTGAAPGQPGFGTALANAALAPVAPAVSWIGEFWPLLALGGIGVLWWIAKRK